MPDIIVTIALIGGCVLFGLVISKFADLIYDRHIKRTTKINNDNRDHVRKLLKARSVTFSHRRAPAGCKP